MKDYQITLKIKNNIMLTAMKKAGFDTAASLSRATGVCQITTGYYLNLVTTPYNKRKKDGLFKQTILDISRVLKTLPEDLFPPQHLKKALSKNKLTTEVSLSELECITNNSNPEKLIEFKEQKNEIDASLSTLNDRENFVIKRRFGIDCDEKTLEECSNALGITRERVRQIEAKGLRKLRHPKRLGKLKQAHKGE